MNQFMFDNPFTECTARDMDYSKVVEYWCDPFNAYRNLSEKMLNDSLTPIIIEGSRGSGKTMILKHLSYFCQKDLYANNIISRLKTNGSIGFYYRFTIDFGKLISKLNCSSNTKQLLFLIYFQLYFSGEIIKVIKDLQIVGFISNKNLDDIVSDINNILLSSCKNIDEIIEVINNIGCEMDKTINKMDYILNIDEKINEYAMLDNCINKICYSIQKNIHDFKDIKFLILIDEYENIFEFQRIVNTLIKQVDSTNKVTYRIGMRPEGFITYNTNVGAEFIQPGRDYIFAQLSINKHVDFQELLKSIVKKRLETSLFFKENQLLDIIKILGLREDWVSEALNAVKNRPQKHFELINNINIHDLNNSEIVKKISCPENPLIEMLNILWINRGISPDVTARAMNKFIASKRKEDLKADKDNEEDMSYKYFLDYDMKYKYSLLFVLLAKLVVKKKYYSFTTFSYLVSGSINDFISLCRNTFACLEEKDIEELLIGNPIPEDCQHKGAESTALELVDKIRLCDDNGREMYTFIMNMGELFKSYHKDPALQYPETNQFAFENEAAIYNNQYLNTIVKNMIKWGVIEKRIRKQSISIGKRKGDIYKINRLVAPIYVFSYRTRGGYNYPISTTLFKEMLNNSLDVAQIKAINKKGEKIILEESNHDKRQIYFRGMHDE